MPGNHDYGDPPLDYWKPQFQIAYTWRPARWLFLEQHGRSFNGEHGNAGNYERCGNFCPEIINGASLKRLFEDVICGNADIVLSAHDHKLQWPMARCGTEFIVSGAGSKTAQLVGRDAKSVSVIRSGQATVRKGAGCTLAQAAARQVLRPACLAWYSCMSACCSSASGSGAPPLK